MNTAILLQNTETFETMLNLIELWKKYHGTCSRDIARLIEEDIMHAESVLLNDGFTQEQLIKLQKALR